MIIMHAKYSSILSFYSKDIEENPHSEVNQGP